MERVRTIREAEDAIQVLVRRIELLASVLNTLLHNMVRIVDLYSLPAVRKVLEHPLEDGIDTVDTWNFVDALANVPTVEEHCRRQRMAAVLEAMRAGGAILAAETAPPNLSQRAAGLFAALHEDACAEQYKLGVHWFGCTLCEPPSSRAPVRTGPAALRHRCNRATPPRRANWFADGPEERFRIACGRVAVSGGCGKPWYSAISRLKALKIMEINKLDPATTLHRGIPHLSQCIFFGFP
jgi:hypothetical protein